MGAAFRFLWSIDLAGAFIHSTAIVDPGAEIGNDTKIWHWVHISVTAKVGRNCVLGQNVFIGSHVIVGNNVRIQNNVSVYEGVILEDDVFCGPSMVFTNVINPRASVSRKDEYKKTLVKRGATIGANATILCGVTIGTYAFIGAGAVVTKNVRDYELVSGVPARSMGWMGEHGVRLQKDSGQWRCPVTRDVYLESPAGLVKKV